MNGVRGLCVGVNKPSPSPSPLQQAKKHTSFLIVECMSIFHKFGLARSLSLLVRTFRVSCSRAAEKDRTGKVKCLVYDWAAISLRNWQWFFIAVRLVFGSRFCCASVFCVVRHRWERDSIVGAILVAYILHISHYIVWLRSRKHKKSMNAQNMWCLRSLRQCASELMYYV